jgi:hypothetical protein
MGWDHRWRQHVPLKRRSTIILHGSTSQKTILNCIYLVTSVNTGATFADYSAISLNTLPTATKLRSAYWRFKSHLLYDKSLVAFFSTVINYYATIAEEDDDLLTLWDQMKTETRVQTQRHESS